MINCKHISYHNTCIIHGANYLSEITRMVLVHHDSVMVGTTGVTASTGVTTVLANTTVTSRDVTALLSVVVKSSRLQQIISMKQRWMSNTIPISF
jgi:hypothetical protein